ncbi:MAG: hypothetical protein PHY16_17910 [Methylobacter sp.]|nr:hypothetical protein [Methylobacter sp.]
MLKKLLLTILAVIVIFEEWLWDILTVTGHWLSRVLHLARFDEQLSKASPPMALLAFLIPLIVVMPLNLLALFQLTHGRVMQGILLEIAAKLLATLLVARVFRLVRPALLTFNWFAKLYTTIISLLRWAHDLIRDSAVYRLSLVMKAAVKARLTVVVQYFGL